MARYSVRKKKRYDFGIVDIYLDMSNDLIRDVKISGDFFGRAPIDELEKALSSLSLEELRDKVKSISVNEYIFGMDSDMLASQMLE